MDISDPDITFNESGVCNHCVDYRERQHKLAAIRSADRNVRKIAQKLKKEASGKRYDCIIGVSGGVDSSYVVFLAKQLGLRGLLVHLDNGWNSELATKNIESLVSYSGFDLFTLVVEWSEIRDLQRAFFDAGVIDIELISDHAIFATVYRLARKYNVKYLLSGENFETEAIMAPSWNWRKSDAVNIKAIHRRFGKERLLTYPLMSTARKLFYNKTGLVTSIPILDYIDYNKDQAKKELALEVGWVDYGGKHYESIFTRFYQGYILPRKFNVDKRKAHLSSLINSQRLSRSDALQQLETDTYGPELQKSDMQLVCKKLGFSASQFKYYMESKIYRHSDYPNDTRVYELLLKLNRVLKNLL